MIGVGVNEKSGCENLGLGVSSDEQVSVTAGPSCNIGSRETSGEAGTGLMGTVNGGLSRGLGGGMRIMGGDRERVDKGPGWEKTRTRDL
jgi:hypothetical protein